jgi:hypothetical protein
MKGVKMAKGRQRSAKWYFRNEKEVMQDLGLIPTKGSGSSWIDKEDGSNDFIIAQLKSTDKESYTLKKLDLEKLEYNATVSNKTPVFIIEFLKDGSKYALMAIEDIPIVSDYIRTGKTEKPNSEAIWSPDDGHKKKQPVKPKIKSDPKAREKYLKQKEKEWENKKWKK